MPDPRAFGLTDRAAELLDYLRFCADQGAAAPTYQEMADNLGVKSKSNIHRMIGQLVERGLVQKLPGRHQSVSLVDRHTLALPEREYALLCAAAMGAGRTPSAHAAAIIRAACPDQRPDRPTHFPLGAHPPA